MSIKCVKAIFIVLLAVLAAVFAPESMPDAARRMVFIFVFAAFFWALEIIPLFATSIVVVLLEVLLLARPGGVLNMGPTDYQVFLLPFGSPIIMLFFGGFVLAAVMHKHKVDEFISRRIIRICGTKPSVLLMAVMLITAFLSMWMSNTATTAMMIAMFSPILRQIDTDDPIRRGLLLSIPFAANIGGIGTPIGTPPNAIAIGMLSDAGIHIYFLQWMKLACPLVVILLSLTGLILFYMYRPKTDHILIEFNERKTLTPKAKMVVIISVITILLWLSSGVHHLPAAIIALLAAAIFIAGEFISRDDLKNLNWDVLILMWGGLALGKGMQLTGLTTWVVGLPFFSHQGFILIAVFAALGMLLSTFVSNTATANLLIPIVMSIPGESTIMLAVSVALACSIGMALPVSTPPNAIAFSSGMIHSSDMFKAGLVISILALMIILFLMQFFASYYGL